MYDNQVRARAYILAARKLLKLALYELDTHVSREDCPDDEDVEQIHRVQVALIQLETEK